MEGTGAGWSEYKVGSGESLEQESGSCVVMERWMLEMGLNGSEKGLW